MPFPIIGLLVVKGAALVVKAVVAHHKVAAVSKGIAVATKTYGAANVAAASAFALTVVGGIAWSVDRVNDAKECYNCWEKGDNLGMVKKMGGIVISFSTLQHNPHTIFHSAGELLKEHGVNSENAVQFVKDLNYSITDIEREMKRDI
jgi:hypothetical protein